MLLSQLPRIVYTARRINLAFALLLALTTACGAQNISKPTVLSSCANLFGASIDPKLNLFEVNQLFVLQPKFDATDNLIALAVFPKYWLEEFHPEWTEPQHWPLFSPAEFQRLLAHTEGVVAKGKLLAAGSGSVITNSTAYFLDRYERAYVRHGNVVNDVRFIEVYPFHEIEGNVRKKKRERTFMRKEFYRVLVGELNYFIERDQYRKLVRGRKQKLLVVGPIKGYCYAGFCNP